MNEERTLTIREEEAVEALMMEEYFTHPLGADPEIEDIIRHANCDNLISREANIVTRNAVNIQDQDFDIKTIVQQVQGLARVQLRDDSLEVHRKKTILEDFDKEQMDKLRFYEDQFLQLESKYPKIKQCLLHQVQYPSVRSVPTKTERWFAFNGKDISDATDATVMFKDGEQFRLFALDEELYCFTSADGFCEPLIVKPGKGKTITCLSISTCQRYLVIALLNQIVVYEVNSNKSISLIKNVTDLKAKQISHVGFCGNGFERIYVVDSKKYLIIVSIVSTFLFYRVEVQKMEVCVAQILALDWTCYLADDEQYVLLAVCSRTEAAIYLLTPSRQLLHLQIFQDELVVARMKLNTQGNSVDEHTVDCKWRYDPSNGIKPQLIVSFENRIIIVKMTQANTDIVPFQARFGRFLHYSNHYSILGIVLLTYNHLLIQSASNLVVVAIPLITSLESGQECEESSIIHVDSRAGTRIFQTYVLCHKSIIITSEKAQLMEVICLQQYVDREIVLRNDHMSVFCLLLMISRGLNYSFDCNYSEAELTKIIFYSVQSLLTSLSKISTDSTTLAIRLYWVCQLLIESGRQYLLWSLVYSFMKNTVRKQEVMFQCLEGFFLRGLISSVPEEVFVQIVQEYIRRERTKVLLKAILTTNLEGHNVERYLQLISEKQLYSLFIFLFQNLSEEADYLTPFVKIFSNFKACQDADRKQYLGKLSLWYLSKCFRGFKFPDTPMSQKQKQSCLRGLLVDPLNPAFFKPLTEFAQDLLLTIYLYVCTNQSILSFVHTQNQFFVQKLKNFYDQAVFSTPFFPQVIMMISKAYKKQSPLLYHFVAVCSLKVPVDSQLLYSTCLYYLTYPSQVAQSTLQILNPLEKDSGKILLHMLIVLRPLLKSNRLYLKKLLSHKSSHWQVVSYLHFLDGKYQVAIHTLLDSQKREDVFLLLRQIFQQVEESRLPDTQLREIVMIEVGRMVRVNPRQTLKILRLLNIDIEGVLKQLKKLPQLKLSLIASLIQANAHQDRDQSFNLLVEHLELVCEFSNKKVMKYLRTVRYPLDEAIKICERFSHFEGKAYMLERSGDIRGALQSYEKAVVLKIKDNSLDTSQMKVQLSNYFESTIQICKNNPCHTDTPVSQNNWLVLMEIVKDIQDSNHSQKVDVMIELNHYFVKVHQELFKYVPANTLLDYFLSSDNRGFLPRILLKSWHTLAGLLKFQFSVYKQAIQASSIDSTMMLDIYATLKWKGVHSQCVVCSFCDNPLVDEQELIVFSCEHAFHKVCHKSTMCLACKFQSDCLLIKSTVDRIVSKRKQSQAWSIGKELSMSAGSGLKDIVVIEIQTIEDRRKRLRPKLKAFQFQVSRRGDQVEAAFQSYFDRKKTN